MSNKLNDGSVMFVAGGVTPTIITTNLNAAGVDMATADYCYAIQVVGTVAGTTSSFVGAVQEATTATGTYTNVSGASFATITSTTGAGGVQVVGFQRNKQYLRFVGTVAGTSDTTTTLSVELSVLFCGQKKQY